MAKTITRTSKPFYAALGAGSIAVDKARELPERVVKLPATVTSRIGELPNELAERVRKLSNGNGSLDLRTLPKKAQELPDRARKLTTDTQKRAKKAYTTLTKEGEKVVKQLQKRRSKGKKSSRSSNGRKKSDESTQVASVPSISSATGPSVNAEPVVIDGQQSL